jgi:hypothetical protein
LLQKMIRGVWLGPSDAIGKGLAGGPARFLTGATERKCTETVVCIEGGYGPMPLILKLMGKKAVTVGRAVISVERLEGPIKAHELGHVDQAERLGPAYIPRYVGEWLWCRLCTDDRHSMEREANEFQRNFPELGR